MFSGDPGPQAGSSGDDDRWRWSGEEGVQAGAEQEAVVQRSSHEPGEATTRLCQSQSQW